MFVAFLTAMASTATLLMPRATRQKLPRGSSDAALSPYHVDQLFVMDRLSKIKSLDATRVTNTIEFTRFPPSHGANDGDSKGGMLVRAADLIGQLGDPRYLRKANALSGRRFRLMSVDTELAVTPYSGSGSSAELIGLFAFTKND